MQNVFSYREVVKTTQTSRDLRSGRWRGGEYVLEHGATAPGVNAHLDLRLEHHKCSTVPYTRLTSTEGLGRKYLRKWVSDSEEGGGGWYRTRDRRCRGAA